MHLAKMALRRRRACAGGQVTGYFAGGSREGLGRAQQTQCCSRIIHLTKLKLSYELFGLFVTELII